jgi:hypothetical protein
MMIFLLPFPPHSVGGKKGKGIMRNGGEGGREESRDRQKSCALGMTGPLERGREGGREGGREDVALFGERRGGDRSGRLEKHVLG